MPPTSEMRAIVFTGPAGDPSTTQIAWLPTPRPAPGEVTIDVHYAGISFKDVMSRRGDAGYVSGWPFVPGLEVAGTVREVGDGVTHLMVGQRVAALTNSGGLAEVAVAQARLTALVPAALDLELAAAAPGTLTTASLLLGDVARLAPGETMLVHSAAGGVGRAVGQLARHIGAGTILGTVGSRARIPAVKRARYDEVLVRGPDLAALINDHTGGRGVDVILDPQGTAWLEADLDCAAPGARIVLFGNAGGVPLEPIPAGRLFARSVSVGGFSLAVLSAHAPERVGHALALVLEHLLAGELDPDLMRIPGLHAVPAAQQSLAEGGGNGKQVVSLLGPHTQLGGDSARASARMM